MTVMPFRPRGTAEDSASATRAIADPYAGAHRARRKAMWQRSQRAAAGPVQAVRAMMYAWQGRAIHLHHSGGLAQKLAGLPGDTLMCQKCNRSAGGREGAQLTNGKPSRAAPARRSRQW